MIIDPMHNLFLGTAKRMMDRWVADEIIADKKLAAMQKSVKKIVLPPDYTMLRNKIGKGFPYMKADEWKSICKEDIESAHTHLQQFCHKCKSLYKLDLLSPNMHLHLHLWQTIVDFGPVYSYWLFSFERYNSILKNIQTNCKSGFELTYMRRFVEETYKADVVDHVMGIADIHSYLDIFKKNPQQHLFFSFSLTEFVAITQDESRMVKGNEPLPPATFPLVVKSISVMPEHEYNCLVEYYQVVYNDYNISCCKKAMTSPAFVNDRIEVLKSIEILRQVYKGCNGNGHGSYIQALFQENRTNARYGYVGEIQYILVHTFSPSTTTLLSASYNNQHTFDFVRWFKTTSDMHRQPEDIEIYHDNFYKLDFQSILPIHRTLLPVAIIDYKTRRNVNRKIAIPLPQKNYA
ncbi:hypothetical protein PHYBLDRAFT_167158 [Phycomyces blakesleeanus NRRL 1555(-)]|uniref:Uncharacterized protein n=1 Tax=Phycomyces blakesleeanus (strain ATCC 8743b / DSM 1359 / FGSC 10004 / NBRC 33097 / NRRL 1555) TaxID=763407 RepID=A0A162UFQ7_PHYB8|nr:hypothetical protein PHYBLDRAFT_167158 [Phycomyces blakesleeanus NRRL 1555(-)]OAD74813.1 hypothetical protein PHYBLDRAFT_167158 [Phycomyces blakesleeanus NRRL 1555(-)]|eukprot:XP_018292853.1 hypothetical protein PHYBLDRAFT_167158 [Phycomyces blakesleeanus NRRL 1555(-)]